MVTQPSAATIDLRPLFAPRSIAVIGASPRSSIALTIRDNITVLGSETRCHFVNPRYDEVFGSPCYPSLADLPETPDIAVIALNPLRAAEFTEAAALAGVPAVIIPGGGVIEGGEAAARMQAEVREIAIRHRLALLGPNCMGVFDLTTNSATYIGDINPYLPRGGVAAIAQSGSVSDAFIHSGNRTGFSRIISCGSEVVLDACDYLAYCLDDPETTAVALFLEGFRRPERFLALADRALELGKPILVVKVGRTAQARAAALAHSGSLAGEDRVTDAAMAAAGIIRCADLDELLEAAELVDGMRRTGRRVGRGRTGIVSVSTGEASLITDLAEETGIELPPMPSDVAARIQEALPTMGFIANPIDPWGAAEPATAYGIAFEEMAASGAFDVLVLVHDFPYRSMRSEVETANTVLRPLLAATAERREILPLYMSLTSGEPPEETMAILANEGSGAPMLRGTRESLFAIARVARWERRRAARTDAGPVRPAWRDLARDRTPFGLDPGAALRPSVTGNVVPLPEADSLNLLRSAGLAVTPAIPAADPAKAIEAAAAFDGRPVAIKLDAVGLAHKTDAGAVLLDVIGDEAIRAATARLLAMGRAAGFQVRGVLIEPMAPAGLELIVGMRRDPLFGPVVLVGLGGVLAEVLDDVAIRLAPVRRDEAATMLDDLRGTALLDGPRGRPAVDRESVVDLIVRLGDLAVPNPDIVEIDLNPVIAGPDAAIAVDALVIMAGVASTESPSGGARDA